MLIKILTENDDIVSIIEKFFEAGKTKDFSILREIQLDDLAFSSFSDVPPYDLKDFSTAIALEELRFASLSDYDCEMKNIKVSIFDNTAVLACDLFQKGMLVDTKAYTGEYITINGRATFVLIRKTDWKIVHYHFSKIK